MATRDTNPEIDSPTAPADMEVGSLDYATIEGRLDVQRQHIADVRHILELAASALTDVSESIVVQNVRGALRAACDMLQSVGDNLEAQRILEASCPGDAS